MQSGSAKPSLHKEMLYELTATESHSAASYKHVALFINNAFFAIAARKHFWQKPRNVLALLRNRENLENLWSSKSRAGEAVQPFPSLTQLQTDHAYN